MKASRETQVFDFVVRRSREGRPPTLREICEATGITSTNGVSEHLRNLERKGLLRRGGKGQMRTWVPAEPHGAWLGGLTPDHAAAATALARVWDQLAPATLRALAGFAEKSEVTRA